MSNFDYVSDDEQLLIDKWRSCLEHPDRVGALVRGVKNLFIEYGYTDTASQLAIDLILSERLQE